MDRKATRRKRVLVCTSCHEKKATHGILVDNANVLVEQMNVEAIGQ